MKKSYLLKVKLKISLAKNLVSQKFCLRKFSFFFFEKNLFIGKSRAKFFSGEKSSLLKLLTLTITL